MPVDRNILKGFSAELYRSGAISFGSYRLRSGRVSPYYIDLRIIISRPRLLRISAELMLDMIKGLTPKPTSLCGIPMTGAVLVSAISAIGDIPGTYIRKEPSIYRDLLKKAAASGLRCIEELKDFIGGLGGKGHGVSRLVDGVIENGDRILVVDDVITTGETKLEAVEILEEEARRRGVSIDIVGIAVLVDREEGGAKELAKRGLKVYRVLSIRDIVETLVSEGLIEGDLADAIYRYIEGVSGER
ncbi:MAG: phosphoribosyltransferase family protein [Desulfurococcales archaeon]|jgi:uridine monophosphate synthetase|nr:phosphoribosyltransferase family protein [Desulfurococcales archaeon]